MARQAAVVLYALVLIAVVVGVDVLFFRNRFWERLEAAFTSLTAARHWSVNTLGLEVITKAAPYGSTCLPLVGPYLVTAFSKAQSTRPGRLFLHHTKGDVHATANTPGCACGRSCTGPNK